MLMKALATGLVLASVGVAHAAPLLTEGFDNVAGLTGSGWVLTNNSSPVGETSFFQGNPEVFPAQAGAPDAYIAANYLNAADGGAISNWLLTPMLALDNGLVLTFAVRAAGDGYLDTVEARLSQAGASANVGVTATSVGDFTMLLGAYSTSSDDGWIMQSFTVSGLAGPVDGRFAFRYVVDDTSVNGNYIGIDTVAVTAVPEPASVALLALGLSGLWLLRRRV